VSSSSVRRMHPDQLDVDAETAGALVRDQFPQWRTLPVRPVTSNGTVNTLFRLGDELVLRFPLQPDEPAARLEWLRGEAEAARRILGRLPVPTPEPVALGSPGHGYPSPWAVYRWLPGTVATEVDVAGSPRFAEDLAEVVLALRRMDTAGRTFTGTGRGGRLDSQDAWVASCLELSAELIDTIALSRLWSRLRTAARDATPDRWTHGDLMPGNLLVAQGRLAAVLDVGGLAPADPALDLMPAWNLMAPASRTVFRDALGSDDDEWERGKGWAFAQAMGCLHYYRRTNPVMSATASRTLHALLDDERA
jgi:aminoglycoside phosphotransferase (APT) family kinase protein